MPTPRVVEALDVADHSARASSRVRQTLWAVRSVFNDEKKLSIAEFSQTFSARLIEQAMPLSASRR
jgi:hypothetical protein